MGAQVRTLAPRAPDRHIAGVATTPERLASRLAAHPASDASRLLKRAAVAAVFRFAPRPEVLLIERAARAGDRWSGHVSFPGGLESPGDGDLRATAVRETREEVGLDLDAAGTLLGRLDPVRAIGQGRLLPMTITPFVFRLEGEHLPVLNHEVASLFWLPFDEALAGRFDDVYEYRLGPLPMKFPCWRFEGHPVWGLTYQMLRALAARLEDH
jgi:8-oxo-dGTP pyrophosphatase MutT (NUDIX family)